MINETRAQARKIADGSRNVLLSLIELHQGPGIPNMMVFNDGAQVQFNLVLGEVFDNININVSVYDSNINAYMSEFVLFIPDPDITLPREATGEDIQFTLRGGPTGNMAKFEKPIGAMSMEEAVESALEYLTGKYEDMLHDMLGGATFN